MRRMRSAQLEVGLRAEALGLGLCAALPLAPFALRLAREGVPRFALFGDSAAIETATRLVGTGKTLLGPYSRFLFNHPGPLYFYVLAPMHRLCGDTSTGILAGALFLNVLAIVVSVASVRLASSRAHAIGAAVVLALWSGAFGNALFHPWSPLVVVTPLLAFLVCSALSLRVRGPSLLAAVFFGSLAAQTHIATIPVVVGVGAVVGVAAIRRRRAGVRRPGGERAWTLASAALLALFSLPILIEQLSEETGNLTKLARFVLSSHEPAVPWRRVLLQWLTATSWLPERLIHRTLSAESMPIVQESLPVIEHASFANVSIALVWLATSTAALVTAIRRRDRASSAILVVGLAASLLSLVALHKVTGETYDYLVFWTTAATTTVWLGVASVLASALAAYARRNARVARSLPLVATATLLVSVAASTLLTRSWTARNRLADAPNPALRDSYEGLVAHLRRTGETPVLHREVLWHVTFTYLNELTRDGIPVAVMRRDRWILGRQLPNEDAVPRPLHVYTQTYAEPYPPAACLTRIAFGPPVEVLAADHDVVICPP